MLKILKAPNLLEKSKGHKAYTRATRTGKISQIKEKPYNKKVKLGKRYRYKGFNIYFDIYDGKYFYAVCKAFGMFGVYHLDELDGETLEQTYKNIDKYGKRAIEDTKNYLKDD